MEAKRMRLSDNYGENRNSKFQFVLWQNTLIETCIDDNFINT